MQSRMRTSHLALFAAINAPHKCVHFSRRHSKRGCPIRQPLCIPNHSILAYNHNLIFINQPFHPILDDRIICIGYNFLCVSRIIRDNPIHIQQQQVLDVRFIINRPCIDFFALCMNFTYHIVTDIRMPKFDGLELISRIRQYNKLIPIIIISGY